MKRTWLILLLILILLGISIFVLYNTGHKIDFNAQVKPILNKKCISCHGGVKQQGGFSVLFREEALRKTKSGKYGVIPGDASASEMIKRITADNAEERMPYKHAPLSKDEISILKDWINQGAEWGIHWAYKPIEKPQVPDIADDWVSNDIDKFILQKLQQEKLKPSVIADKATLVRRVSLDLIGLPASESTAANYLNNNSASAYNQLVDSLLSQVGYGEKWATLWLDLARYSDTKGFESDQPRTIWRYRDWVIHAFNDDLPYNEFLTQQIAGDLMPGADDNKYIATAFHRNTLNNDEGGTENEEFRTAAVMDRVNTTWSAILGTTFNCVQCHSHPYDQFRHEDYYKFLAFFNNTRDEDMPSDYPQLRIYAGKDSTLYEALKKWIVTSDAPKNEESWYLSFLKTLQPSVFAHKCDSYENGLLYQKNYVGLDANGICRLPGINTTSKKYILFRYLNNKSNAVITVTADSLKGKVLTKIPIENTNSQWHITMAQIDELEGVHNLWFHFRPAVVKDDLPLLIEWFAFAPSFPGEKLNGGVTEKKQFLQIVNSYAEGTPVLVESNEDQKRITHVFERGSWLLPGKEVSPGVPSIFNPLPPSAPLNRLGLAMWLTDKKNPLTARTIVNRVWEQLFGTGLVETVEDMGTQSTTPIYKDLLDYLSWKFMNDCNWSIKKLLKEIVLSSTYRQLSISSKEALEKDPRNNFLARYPRVRLTGEQLRDQGLALSGLLSKKMYGPGVMPYQPEGIWSSPYNASRWVLSEGENQYRRAIYTFWKRTAPYPSLMNFDGGSREVCVLRRIRTNTPLQALNTLNDSAYLVMARAFSIELKKLDSIDAKKQITEGYERMFYKPISSKRLEALLLLYQKSVSIFNTDVSAARLMMGDKDKTAKPQDAALVVVANAMLNLDEWLNKN